jgi:hypothetical protein
MIAEKGADIIKELWQSTKKERKKRSVILNNSTNIKKRHGSKARKNSQ